MAIQYSLKLLSSAQNQIFTKVVLNLPAMLYVHVYVIILREKLFLDLFHSLKIFGYTVCSLPRLQVESLPATFDS